MSLAESEKIWVAFCDSDFFGPLSAVEIKNYLTENKIKDDDCLWRKGWDKWKQPKDIPIFSYECKQSMGTGRPIPEMPVPIPEEFTNTISPKVSPNDLGSSSNWDAKRITIVVGSTLFAGVAGGVVAGVLTKKNQIQKEAELEKASMYVDDKNK